MLHYVCGESVAVDLYSVQFFCPSYRHSAASQFVVT